MIVLVLFLESAGCIYTMQPKGFELSIFALILEVMAHQIESWSSVGDSPNAGVCLNKAVAELTLLDFFQAQASTSSDSDTSTGLSTPVLELAFKSELSTIFSHLWSLTREVVDSLSHSCSS